MPLTGVFGVDSVTASGRTHIIASMSQHRQRLEQIKSSPSNIDNKIPQSLKYLSKFNSQRLKDEAITSSQHEILLKKLNKKINSYPNINDRKSNRFDATANPVYFKRNKNNNNINKINNSGGIEFSVRYSLGGLKSHDYYVSDSHSNKMIERGKYNSSKLITEQIKELENKKNKNKNSVSRSQSSLKFEGNSPLSNTAKSLNKTISSSRPLSSTLSPASKLPSYIETFGFEKKGKDFDDVNNNYHQSQTNIYDNHDEKNNENDNNNFSDDEDDDSDYNSDSDIDDDDIGNPRDPYYRFYQTLLSLLYSHRITKESSLQILFDRACEINNHLNYEKLLDVCEGVRMEWTERNNHSNKQSQSNHHQNNKNEKLIRVNDSDSDDDANDCSQYE